ncbi:MAG TPA: NAD(P)-binding protein [Rhodocyclaceae bacterium]|nr:NAD(P)-binding protein [Rhodocyclaceae bacterium]
MASRPALMERRRFLAASATSLAFPFIACSRKTESGVPPGFLQDAGIDLGHQLRDGGFPEPTETLRIPVLIVGAGVGGLSAGWRLQKKGCSDFRIIELAERCGGNSRYADRTDNPVSAHPLGAHYLPLPTREAVFVRELLADLGAIEGDPQIARPFYDERKLCHSPQERLYRNGIWQDGLIPQLGLGRDERGEIARFLDHMAEFRAATDTSGRRAFALPAELSSPEPRWRKLDLISMSDWLLAAGFRSPALHWYVDYACRDDFGTTAATTSAWAGIHYFACRNGEAANAPGDAVLTAPEGNGWIVRALTARLAGHLATDAAAFRIDTVGPRIRVDVWLSRERRSVRYECQQLIWAAPLFLLPRLAPTLPEAWRSAAGSGSYAPWLVANLTLSEPPQDGAGVPLAWDNVPYGGSGLGYVVATHQQLRLSPGATVITWYQALAHTPPAQARQTLLATTREQWAEQIFGQLAHLHRDLRAHTRRFDLFRHGHAMIRPTPGTLWGATRQRLTQSLGKIHFAHADVSGLSLFEEANYRGVLAADKILAQLG